MRVSDINILSPEEIAKEMARARAEERSQFFFQHRLADGSLRDVEVFSGPIALGKRQLLYSIVHDITERREAEARVAHINRVLRAMRDVGEAIMREGEAGPLVTAVCNILVERRSYHVAMVILTDSNGVPAVWAQRGMEDGGATLDTLCSGGRLPCCCHRVAGQAAAIQATRDHETCPTCVEMYRDTDALCVRLLDGERQRGFLCVALAPELAVDEEERQLFSDIAADVAFALRAIETEEARATAEREREELGRQLLQSQKMEAVGQLAGGIAHDFNNILQGILGYTEILMETAEAEGRSDDDLREIHRGAQRAAVLTRQLLAFSRRQVMQPAPVDLNNVIEDSLRMLRRVIGEQVHLEWKPEPRLGTVKADAAMLEQVLLNLCVNARDAMPGGGVLAIGTSHVELTAADRCRRSWVRPGQYACLAVSDEGIGIEEPVLERIFEPFFTTKEAGRGTGLGLSMVYGIVKQHDGLIDVESQVGKGTTIRVYLPLSDEAAPADDEQGAPETGGGTECILLAEDDDSVRRLATRLLERGGYTVLAAADGASALELFQREPGRIGLLLFDVIMPGMGGPETAARIHETHPGVPILFASGYNDVVVESGFVLRPGMNLVKKPYSATELLGTVRRALDANGAAGGAPRS